MRSKEVVDKEYVDACIKRAHISCQIEMLHAELKPMIEKQYELWKELREIELDLKQKESGNEETNKG